MIQDIIVVIIGIVILVWLGRKAYDFFILRKGKIDKCAGCSGCDLKDEIERYRTQQRCQ